MYSWVWNHVLYIVLSQGEHKNLFKRDIVDQNTTYLFACKDIHVAYLNLNLQLRQGIQPVQTMHLKSMFNGDWVTFELINQ